MNITQRIINVLFIIFLLINIGISFICIFHLAEKEEDKLGCVLVSGLFGGYATICTVTLFWVIIYTVNCLIFNN